MPASVYFVDYPNDFREEPSIEFKKGEELKTIIATDPSLEIRKIHGEPTVFYSYDNDWHEFFILQEDGDIYLNARVIEHQPALYYKIIEIADKLQHCLEIEDVLIYAPQYGMLVDIEEPENGLKYDVYGYEITEILEQQPELSVREAIDLIQINKAKEETIGKKAALAHQNFVKHQRKMRRNKTILAVIIVIVLLALVIYTKS